MTSAEETVSGATAVQATYSYDAFDNLVKTVETVNGTTTTTMYGYDGWNPAKSGQTGTAGWDVWVTMNGSGGVISRELQGDGVNQVFAQTSGSGTAEWLLTDHLGSVVGETSSNGTLQSLISCSAFGQVANNVSVSGNPISPLYVWQGMQIDLATGMGDDRARFYNFDIGQFTSRDPEATGSADPYPIAGNDPLNYTDPSGMDAVPGMDNRSYADRLLATAPSGPVQLPGLPPTQRYYTPQGQVTITTSEREQNRLGGTVTVPVQRYEIRPYMTVQQPTLGGSEPVSVVRPNLSDLENMVVGGVVGFGSLVVNGISAFVQHRAAQLGDLSEGNLRGVIQREGSFNAGVLLGAVKHLAPNLNYLFDVGAVERRIAGAPGFNREAFDLGVQSGPLAAEAAIFLLTEGIGAAARAGTVARPARAALVAENAVLVEQIATRMRANAGSAYSEYVRVIRSGGRPTPQMVENAFQDLLRAAPSNAADGPLFGQRRVGPTFGTQGRPPHLAGRSISDVAADLRAGILSANDLPIEAFRLPDGRLVSANTRSLAALSEAGLRPTIVTLIEPMPQLLQRLTETPIIPNAPLPGPRVPVTPSQLNLEVLRVIDLP